MAIVRGRGWLRSGWWPAAAVALLALVLVTYYGLPVWQFAAFAAYVGLGVALPGVLWWRLARGGARWIGEDIAGGLCVGYAFEILTYLPARAMGAPQLTIVWAAATLAAFAAVPRLRPYWRGAAAPERPPLWWQWLLATAVAFVLLWSAITFFRFTPLTGAQSPYVDMMFQVALAGELKHHVPATIPWVQGEPLNYHWFLYPEVAATSWLTGLEPLTLLYRLTIIPMLAAIVVLVAITARRVTRAWWTGPAAVAVFLLSFAPNPFRWADNAVFDAQSLGATWTSPTHIFGMVLFSAVTLTVIYLLRGEGSRRIMSWVVLALLVFANSGSKATYLPMLVAGLVLAIIGHAIVYQRPWRTALAALAITAAGVLFAQFVVLGGSDGALVVAPLASAKRFTIGTATGLTTILGDVDARILMGLSGIAVLCWVFLWAGAFGLAARRRFAEPEILTLLGIGLAGIGAVLVFSHNGAGQLYFLRGAGPALGIVTTAGLAAVLPQQGRSRAAALAVVGGLALGAAVTTALWLASAAKAPKVAPHQALAVGIRVAIPYLVMAGAVVLVSVALFLLRRRVPAIRGLAVATVLAMMMGLGLPGTWRHVERVATTGFAEPVMAVRADGQPEIPTDAVTAARWLRDHSGADDLVATNSHCLPTGYPTCDNRNFWVAALTERRVFLEGWGYTDTAHHLAAATPTRPFPYVPYWDTARLAENDAAFDAPTAASVGALRDRYGIRWLLAETRYREQPSADLGTYAVERFRAGNYVVYELP